MQTIYEKLYSQIEKQQLWHTDISLKRNEYLKVYGTTDTRLYYIVSGSLKVSIMDGDEEHIVRFGYTDNFITALDSFINEQPSEYCIQALKSCKLKVILKERFIALIHQNTELNELWNLALQQLILQQIEREKDILTTAPKERYKRVLERSPQLFQEIPKKHIASYLRMAPETLSRLQNS